MKPEDHKGPKDPKQRNETMADDTKDSNPTTTTTATTTTTIARDTTTDTLVDDDHEDTSRSSDAPYQGKRSTGGYVPT
jgi:hypothetical protein